MNNIAWLGWISIGAAIGAVFATLIWMWATRHEDDGRRLAIFNHQLHERVQHADALIDEARSFAEYVAASSVNMDISDLARRLHFRLSDYPERRPLWRRILAGVQR